MMKLSPKIILLVLGVLLISMSLLSVPLYWYTRVVLEDALGDQLKRISHLVSVSLDQNLVSTLVQEPQLTNVRRLLEEDLSRFAAAGIDGLTLYRNDGSILAQDRQSKGQLTQLTSALPGLLSLNADQNVAVSEIYQLENGRHVKAAALPLHASPTEDVILVIWAGASYMTIIQQMTGSLFWIILVSILIAISLTLVFSRSLIKPVRQLSAYARSIQTSLNTHPVDLERKDEFGDLNRSLMEMHAEIRRQEESARQLLAGIAHEIKNPLGGMEIYSGLLRDELGALPDHEKVGELGDYLSKITRELHHLEQIVQEYLDYARPLKSVIESVAIREVYENIIALLEPQLKTADQTVILSGEAHIQADRSKLQRVFLNLIKNGLEASAEGGQVRIEIKEIGNQISIAFHDKGTGIPETDWERIFEPYFSTRDRGFGLGLAIVQSIVHEMDGTILVQSSSPEGTVIQLILPRKEASAA